VTTIINWLLAIGCLLVGSGVGLWGLTEVNKTLVIWFIGVPGALCLVLAAGLEFQKFATSDGKANSVSNADSRAYVFVVDADISNPVGSPPTMAVNIKNTGRTPANELTWRAKFEIRPIGERDKVKLDSDAVGVKQTLPPGEYLSYKYTFPAWDKNLDEMLAAESAAIYATGEIRYKDINGMTHFTDYLLMTGGRFGIKSGIAPGKFGNVWVKSD
jgi:hypothetical protein